MERLNDLYFSHRLLDPLVVFFLGKPALRLSHVTVIASLESKGWFFEVMSCPVLTDSIRATLDFGVSVMQRQRFQVLKFL